MKRAASVSHDQPTAHRIKPSPLIKDVEVGVDAWTGGSLAHTTWQSEGDVPEVTIEIVKKGTHLASMMSTTTVARRIANTGTHAFTVPSGLVPGEYQIRVASSAARCSVHPSPSPSPPPSASPPASTLAASALAPSALRLRPHLLHGHLPARPEIAPDHPRSLATATPLGPCFVR